MRGRNRGFTLLEVLIALAVVSIAVGAMIQVAAQRAEAELYLKQHSVASRVADRVMMQLYTQSLNEGVQSGAVNHPDVRWRWRADIQATDNDRILRVDVRVMNAEEPDYALARLTGFKWR